MNIINFWEKINLNHDILKLLPPPITENDSKHGLLSLLERGLIPSTAKITFDQFPISAKTFKRVESSKFDDKMKEYAKVNSDNRKFFILFFEPWRLIL